MKGAFTRQRVVYVNFGIVWIFLSSARLLKYMFSLQGEDPDILIEVVDKSFRQKNPSIVSKLNEFSVAGFCR